MPPSPKALLWTLISQLLKPAVQAAGTSTSAAFDMRNVDGSCVVTLDADAAGAGTNPTLDVKIQDCDTSGGTYVDVAGLAFAQITTVAGVKDLVVETRQVRSFIKVVSVVGGTSSPTFARSVTIRTPPLHYA
jgi:hypothetical protein